MPTTHSSGRRLEGELETKTDVEGKNWPKREMIETTKQSQSNFFTYQTDLLEKGHSQCG